MRVSQLLFLDYDLSLQEGTITILGYMLIIALILPHTIFNCESLARVLIEQLENLLPKIIYQVQVGRGKSVRISYKIQSSFLGSSVNNTYDAGIRYWST